MQIAQISQIINSVFSNLAAVAESTNRHNAGLTIGRETPEEDSRRVLYRTASLAVSRWQDVSFTLRSIQIQAEDGGDLTVESLLDVVQKQELTFERYPTLEQALDHAKIGFAYGHAFVEILAGIAKHTDSKIYYAATASFYRPALMIAVKDGSSVVMFQFTE